ncbi:MAG: diadenosine tetraphosphatase [bacterium]
MPEGQSFNDKDGHHRTEIRIKWWEDPIISNYKQISVEPLESLPETQVDISLLKNINYYSENDKPVFFGHYWLNGNPSIYRDNICCLDYSVAKEGKLVAYRFDGEKQLENNKLLFV